MDQFNFWEFFAGLGVFLLGMLLMEGSLERIAGRTFKKFLRKHTTNPFKAVLVGILITIILQSSSVVSLMVLAFVGAGIIELRNAIGIIIGSNLGTTFTGWIVAYFGFSFEIEAFVFPFLAIGGLSMVFFPRDQKLYHIGSLIVGFGALFMGLDYMKSSIDLFAQNFDISPFVNYSPYVLFFVGFVLTAIIQSSSAGMVITLSALNSGIIPLEGAAAMVIGNDLGTTITVLLGATKGSKVKRQVAFSHFFYNFFIDVFTLIFLVQLLQLVTKVIGTSNPLLTLVAFHSSFNFIGILIFIPLLGVFARLLERMFKNKEDVVAQYISGVPTDVPEAALEVLTKDINHLLHRVILLQFAILNIDKTGFEDKQLLEKIKEMSYRNQYNQVKELEGELVEFYVEIQTQKLESEESIRLKHLMISIRHIMSSAKGIKDIAHNIEDFERSVNDYLINFLVEKRTEQEAFYKNIHQILDTKNQELLFEELANLKIRSKNNYNNFLESAYVIIRKSKFSDIEISTLFNINREIHSSNKSLLLAVKELLLNNIQSKDFDMISENA